ncbi:MAG TPA: hemerythrin domain-containing protein [Burkholderiales bacterium]|nr:hemerythrin domain-containing protein [Burkholderiales bacterium]
MSRTASETNPLAMLAADHETMRQLAEDFQAALEAGADEQSNIVAQICEALEMHTALEEEILYPAARKVTELAVLIDKAREEHERLKETVDEIRALEPSDPQIASLVLQLAEDVEAHVVEEEDVLFPELECRMSSQLTEIGRQMNRLRQRMTQA